MLKARYRYQQKTKVSERYFIHGNNKEEKISIYLATTVLVVTVQIAITIADRGESYDTQTMHANQTE